LAIAEQCLHSSKAVSSDPCQKASRLGVGRRLEGDIAGTAVPN